MPDLFTGCQDFLAALGWSDLLYGRACQLVVGTRMTVIVSLLAMAMTIGFGIVGAIAKLSKNLLARRAADVYTVVIRGVPELILLIMLYFGGTRILRTIVEEFGHTGRVDVNAFAAGVFAIGAVYGAYATEVFRGAILAVPKGQLEAARACGMNRWLVIRRVLMPQVWRFAIPGLGNVWLVLMKATALMSVVGLDELTRKGFIVAGATYKHFIVFTVVALIYLLLTTVSYPVIQWAERYANRGIRRA
jgi:octopine/nopaline transport system permease protein